MAEPKKDDVIVPDAPLVPSAPTDAKAPALTSELPDVVEGQPVVKEFETSEQKLVRVKFTGDACLNGVVFKPGQVADIPEDAVGALSAVHEIVEE